ncbi:MAG: glycosyltransferase family 4 protein [Candidatus Babeliales bacterium]
MPVSMLVEQNSYLERELELAKLPYFSACFGSLSKKNAGAKKDKVLHTHKTLIAKALTYICKNNDVQIVHVNRPVEIAAAREIANKFKFIVVAQEHYYKMKRVSAFRGVQAFTSTSPDVVRVMKRANKKFKIGIQLSEFLPPLAEEALFVDFIPSFDKRDDYFNTSFGFYVGEDPVVCMIANFFRCKNHVCLIKAAAELLYRYQTPIHVILAGDGSHQVILECKELAKSLRVEKYIHFVGFVRDIPSLLYCSDAMVLPSIGEAFSIAVMEAAFMKKPVILSCNAGAAGRVVVHEKTGLLFNPDDYGELALCIKKIIDDTCYAHLLGEEAFALVHKNFTVDAITQKYMQFYKRAYALSEEERRARAKQRRENV